MVCATSVLWSGLHGNVGLLLSSPPRPNLSTTACAYPRMAACFMLSVHANSSHAFKLHLHRRSSICLSALAETQSSFESASVSRLLKECGFDPSRFEMADRVKDSYYRAHQNLPLEWRQVLGLVIFLVAAATVTTVAFVTLAGSAFASVMALPILLLFSPVLIPLGIGALFVIAVALGLGGFASSLVWVYKYFKGAHPVGSDQVGAARFKLNEGAGLVKKKATEYGQEAKSRVQAGTSLASDIIKQTDTNIPNPAP
ncbi:oleosin [Physcomitrium patens]|uniref:oleosin n=1 Tax=Physcomitrium patens TaxID=3218 RepID=UPI00024AE78D|nr:major oleosin NAP-II-like [Physcomitrium patens]|eukprot:XP_024378976.1 major oleosin NAP-II-like [Physcomitrella patens]